MGQFNIERPGVSARHTVIFRSEDASPSARLERISSELALLSSELEHAGSDEPWPTHRPAISDWPDALSRYLKMRREREKLFPKLFGDPAWDMLLLLYVYRAANVPLQVSAIGGLANVPGTTSLRYLDLMVEHRLITRNHDPKDARRVWLNLTPKADDLLDKWSSFLQ